MTNWDAAYPELKSAIALPDFKHLFSKDKVRIIGIQCFE